MDTHVKWRERDRLSNTPRLVIELDGNSTVWTEAQNENYYFKVSLRKLPSGEPADGDDLKDINQPRWSPEIDPGRDDFILLHHGPGNSLHRIGVEGQPRYKTDPTTMQFPTEPPSYYAAEAKDNHDRCNISHRLSFPDTWKKLLQPGHTYDLLWTGGEVSHWDWGTHTDVGTEPKGPPVIVPGGAHITFTMEEGEWPSVPRPATPPLIQASERVPGAPVLSLELSCSPTMTLTRILESRIRVVYHGLSDNDDATTGDKGSQPITFHTYAFDTSRKFRVSRRRCADESSPEAEEEWETFIDEGCCQFGIWDNPDMLMNVSENPDGRFPTLFPGESWSDVWTMTADGYSLPDDLKPGEKLRYQFGGSTLDWWDWGTAEAHAQTIVTLPGSGLELITNPKDNGGRPKGGCTGIECCGVDGGS
ncbi:uncharacterized protein BO80DRAFT_466779 [Aspergillus ibericus CBS 121593]|uniref:Uncharacterized protein n=1 Tax=Aspergillus ibericus CBS 121593 TaxID=1448316 RepID=A0A395GTQ3_9EURO|nr:hypothetical protein BO80DRAFT_466779 [Aspergillus ibericus CBS 121593]RAK98564.1 hypothetical protein BO80DRAFT_466779 [Aspergillus ibericus CBS 121593]